MGLTKYFKEIEHKIELAYSLAGKARKKGFDPVDEVEIPLAKNMAQRVEGILGAVIPQIINSGLSKRIQELEKTYGKLDFKVALCVALETASEKFCKFENKIKAMEAGIRAGLAYLTLGVVSSPLEGFVELKLKKRMDGKEYFCLMYSGPIRSAGGTAGALSVVIADYIRKNTGYDYGVYDPTEDEIKRAVTELNDYHERVTNLQYLPNEKEISFLVKNLPVQIDGDSSEDIEVSNYKDLPRIETNNIRSGPSLVMAECLAQKASKVWNIILRASDNFDLSNWSFLETFITLQKKVKARAEITKGKISPVYTFIEDLVAGRPILTHPLAAGGFRLRYGRTRASGYSATAIHPATMQILDSYIATGTQLKLERPGKATALTVCNTIEGPIVKLKDDTVLRVEDESAARKVKGEVKEILFLGDILISYGDFYNRAHVLVPPGYCEEWWLKEIEKASTEKFGSADLDRISAFLDMDKSILENIFQNPTNSKITATDAFIISRKLNVPLHPRFTYHWNLMSTDEFFYLLEYLTNPSKTKTDTAKIIIKYDENLKNSIDKIGLPNFITNKEFIIIEKDDAHTISEIFNLNSERNIIDNIKKPESDEKQNLFLINQISDIKIRDKSGVFIGARMGRPEKAKMRKLTGNPHVLFPIGEEGGRLRSFQSAFENNKVTAEFPIYHCQKCDRRTIFSVCEKCDQRTARKYYCKTCGILDAKKCRHGPVSMYQLQQINISELFDIYLKKLNIKTYPDLIKGVRGTSNKEHIPEHFIKGLFRAKHDVSVNKDGTIRYDMTQLPLTHFKPKEINVPVDKLKELGYSKDIHGIELENDDQVIELFPQDIILPSCKESKELGADQILFKTSLFVDELLKEFYSLEKFYDFQSENGLIGALVAVMAPHTSAAIIGRIIGFSKTQGFFAHPMLHAATRRDCDGDEASVTLLMDAILNFSKKYLPDSRGSTQDAPLVLTSKIIPAEVDDMVFHLDIAASYPLQFYEACMNFKQPWEIKIEQLGKRIDTEKEYYGFNFTHNFSNINDGVRCSAYKLLPSMEEKLKGQMELAEKIRAVDASDVARLVIEKHLIRDIRGNLRKFSTQEFRCSTCNEKYRRPPLVGKCLKCSGKIIFTISEGSIIKYLEPAISLADKYNLPSYLKQNLELTKRNVESIFGREKEKQEGLGRWFG